MDKCCYAVQLPLKYIVPNGGDIFRSSRGHEFIQLEWLFL